MTQALKEFRDRALYLDAMVPCALLRQIDAEIVKSLFRRIQAGEIKAFTSALTFDELAYRLLLAVIRDNHPGNPVQNLRENEADLIAAYAPRITAELQKLQNFPNLTLVDVDATDVAQMLQFMGQYRLRPRAALHLAAMHKCACFNLASQDPDFDHVPAIQRFII
jgi:predicted nucleic acid-binding protein